MSGGGAWTLCLDFGTAYSKAAAAPRGAWTHFRPEQVRPLMLSSHEDSSNAFLLNSAVFVDDDRILFGSAALQRAEELSSRKRMALRSFKTILSVSDLDRALNTGAPLAIDPHRLFPMRDLIVLYLAYLMTAVERAAMTDPVLSQADQIEHRYAAPAWRGGDSLGMHGAIQRLFGEAEAFRQAFGDKLLSPQGISIKKVADTLPGALSNPHETKLGLIFEATAAAAYTSIGLPDSAAHMIVVDMGAGTTDIAAIARHGQQVEELPAARVTLKQAGDFIDRVIANIVLEGKGGSQRSHSQQSDLWRQLMLHMRDIKEGLFAEGRAVLRYDQRAVHVNMRDLERDADFRAFMKELTQAYDDSLAAVRDVAIAQRGSEIQTIAVGGGAAAPFIQELLRRRPQRSGKLLIEPRPATPEWAYGKEFEGNLAPVFPQLAIAIGGALAPDAMLTAKGGVNPAANGRNGIRVERD